MKEILYSLDDDNDGAADPWELHDWIVWVEKIVHRHVLDEQWSELGMGVESNRTVLSWGDYQALVNPLGARSVEADKRMERDRRRWENADEDENEERKRCIQRMDNNVANHNPRTIY